MYPPKLCLWTISDELCTNVTVGLTNHDLGPDSGSAFQPRSMASKERKCCAVHDEQPMGQKHAHSAAVLR